MKSRQQFNETATILHCDFCRRMLQTQYINLFSNIIISKGSPAMSASPEIRALPALM